MSKHKKVDGRLQHIYEMENILDKATQKMDALEKKIEELSAEGAKVLSGVTALLTVRICGILAAPS